MFAVSDPFCRQYQQWEKTGEYKQDNHGKILRVIKENLEVLSKIQVGQNIKQLEFDKEGKVTLQSQGRGSGKTSVKSRDLKEFTAFVERYFNAKENSLSAEKASEMRGVLAAAKDGVQRLAAQETIFSGLVDTATYAQKRLSEAYNDTVINEKIENVNGQAPGEKLLIDKFQELQKKAQLEQKKANEERKGQKTFKKMSKVVALPLVVGSTVTIIVGFTLLVFFPPIAPIAVIIIGAGAAGLVGGGIFGMGTLIASSPGQANENYRNMLEELKELKTLKENYGESEREKFQNFLDELPEDKRDLVTRPSKHLNLHRLYRYEKRIRENLIQVEKEEDFLAEERLKREISELGERIKRLRESLYLPPKGQLPIKLR